MKSKGQNALDIFRKRCVVGVSYRPLLLRKTTEIRID
jgi:hypothetical protein